MPILFKLIPILTVSVFERYQEAAQFKLVEAEYAAIYKNTKRSQMRIEVSKILDNEQSVKAPILKTIISNEVQTELTKMRNQVRNSQRKIDIANKKLASLKSQKNSAKDWTISEFVKTAAKTEQDSNFNPKKKEKNCQRNPRQREKSHLNSTPTSNEKSIILFITSRYCTGKEGKETTAQPSSTRESKK